MRENDDDVPVQGSEGTLAEGLGDTADPGGFSSTTDPYGDDSYDGTYGDDADGDTTATTEDDTTVVESPSDADDTVADDAVADDDDGFGDGGPGVGDVLPQDASPLEGIGFILDELRDALLGDEEGAASLLETEEAAAAALDSDTAGVGSDGDLDLVGDGLVDAADPPDDRSAFDVEPG